MVKSSISNNRPRFKSDILWRVYIRQHPHTRADASDYSARVDRYEGLSHDRYTII